MKQLDTNCVACGAVTKYDKRLEAWVSHYISGVGYLCRKCKEKWDSPDEEGIRIPHPTKGKMKGKKEDEVFMFGPDAMQGKGETMDKLTELLIITMEECGELTQACSKVLRKQDLEERKLKGKKTLDESMKDLAKEVADVQCMIELLQTEGLVDWADIRQGVEEKRTKLKKWSRLI